MQEKWVKGHYPPHLFHAVISVLSNMCIKNDHHSDEEITYLHLLLQQKEKQTCHHRMSPRDIYVNEI